MPKPSLLSVLGSLSLLGLAACGGAESPDHTQTLNQSTGKAALLAAACSGCHSKVSGGIVSLHAHTADTLRQSLLFYKTDAEGSTVMHRLARGYTEADIDLISEYLGAEGAQ
ncbi:MAG: cytochrome subunit of sulfide dehydrogenase [Henriciella sp.]